MGQKRITTVKTVEEPEIEPEQEPEYEPDEVPEDFFSRFEGIDADAGLRFTLHRKVDDKLYYVGTIYPPVSAQVIATKFGGGDFKVTARKKNGTIAGNDWLYIDHIMYPPKAAPDPNAPTAVVSSTDAKLDKLIEVLTLQATQAPQGRKEMFEEMLLMKQLFEPASPGASVDSMLGLFQKGIETAKEMGNGEKSMVDLVEKFAPELLSTVKSAIDAKRAATQNMIAMRTGAGNNGGNKEMFQTLSLLDDIFKAAQLQDPDKDLYIGLIDRKAPDAVKGKLMSETPEKIIEYLATVRPQYAKMLEVPKVRSWITDLLIKFQTPEEQPQTEEPVIAEK